MSVVSIIRVPHTPEEITVDWLREVLCADGVAGAEALASIKILPTVEGFGVMCSYAILRLEYAQPNPAAPETMFAKFSTESALSAGISQREVNFFRHLAPKVNVRIPHCYFAATDKNGGHSLLLLEDVSSGRAGDSLEGCSIEEAERLMRLIAGMHARWWEKPLTPELSWLDRFSDESIQWVDDLFNKAWIKYSKSNGNRLPGWAEELAENALAQIPRIFHLLSEGSLTVVHGDLQLDNVRFGDTQSPIVLLDWQLCMRAQAGWDVAWFLAHAIPVSMRRKYEDRIVSVYHTALQQTGVRDFTVESLYRQMNASWILSYLNLIMASVETNFSGDRGDDLRRDFMKRHLALLEDHRVRQVLAV